MKRMEPAQIKAVRTTLGLTATELAVRLGVSENTVRRWEMGDRSPRGPAVLMLEQLAASAPKSTGTSRNRKTLAAAS